MFLRYLLFLCLVVIWKSLATVGFVVPQILSDYCHSKRSSSSSFNEVRTKQSISALPIVGQTRKKRVSTHLASIAKGEASNISDETELSSAWLHHGLLLSSFSDGLKPNPKAVNFLMQGLTQQLWQDYKKNIERHVADSAVQSPCCGPTDVDALTTMEFIDDELQKNRDLSLSTITDVESSDWRESFKRLQNCMSTRSTAPTPIQPHEGNDDDVVVVAPPSSSSCAMELRFLYIPTAMYALRKDSKNTPGKQRQRARADGKKRRNEIVQLLQSQFSSALKYTPGASRNDGNDENLRKDCPVSVRAVTLDLEDGSIKQPEAGDNNLSDFPKNGKDAFQKWKPHFVYVQGGNTFWLYHCIEKGDWKADILHSCIGKEAAVYAGTSAGAILMGQSMDTACWKQWDDPSVVPGRESYEDWKEVKGFGLVGKTSFFPHMTEQWQTLVDNKMQDIDKNQESIMALRDEDVCLVKENACEMI